MMKHILNILTYHPMYLKEFVRTHNFILKGDGPLSLDYRYIIGIMAAGRHECCCLINMLKTEFLQNGGDETWLHGLKSIPRKLQKLYEVNKILAHMPWLLNKSNIEDLTKGEDNWSLSELVHAIILLVYFHSFSSFIFACGISKKMHFIMQENYENLNKDAQNITNAYNNKNSSDLHHICSDVDNGDPSSSLSLPSIVGEQEVKVETLMERMKDLLKKNVIFQITEEERSIRFQTIEEQSAQLTVAPLRNNPVLSTNIGVFIDDPDFIYQDFSKRGQLGGVPTFRIQDYSWDDHGYSLVNSLYQDVGNLLDDKFKTAYNLTYNTMAEHSQVDTSRFRIAVWNYIQCLYGIKHDDYDYNEVNQLLEKSLKIFIKNAACYPERVTKKDYDRVMPELKQSEKIHVNLIIIEARMQAALLYALRTMMHFTTH